MVHKVGIKKLGDLWTLTLNGKEVTWSDFDPFGDVPAVYQTKKEAEKDLKRLEGVLKTKNAFSD